MMKLLLTAFALAGILSAPALIRSSPAAFPPEGIAVGKRIEHPDANVRFEASRVPAAKHPDWAPLHKPN
jgi:hypothetical protein